MNLTNIKYLYDLMDKEKFTFFTVYDSKNSPMRDQCNENYTVQDAKDDLEQFLQYNSGVFRVEFRRTKANTDTTRNFSFSIDNLKQEKREPMTGIGNMDSGADYLSIISAKDDKIEKLQSEMFANMMAAMSKQHELQMEALKTNLNKDTGNDALLQTAVTAISGMFGGGSNIALSGFDTMDLPVMETTKTNTIKPMLVDDNRQKINNAVVRLMKADRDFASNITKLADIADENPLIYNMAISKLQAI
jgi:hypothetical protein